MESTYLHIISYGTGLPAPRRQQIGSHAQVFTFATYIWKHHYHFIYKIYHTSYIKIPIFFHVNRNYALFSLQKNLKSIQKTQTTFEMCCSPGLFCTGECCQDSPGTQPRHVCLLLLPTQYSLLESITNSLLNFIA